MENLREREGERQEFNPLITSTGLKMTKAEVKRTTTSVLSELKQELTDILKDKDNEQGFSLAELIDIMSNLDKVSSSLRKRLAQKQQRQRLTQQVSRAKPLEVPRAIPEGRDPLTLNFQM